MPVEEEAYDISIKDPDKRWHCTCFVEGDFWEHPKKEIPSDCPKFRHCRYYIKHY